MNKSEQPFHAIGFHDCLGSLPSLSNLPREEDDFETLAEAQSWLRERGGGTVEVRDKAGWKVVATVEVEGGAALNA